MLQRVIPSLLQCKADCGKAKTLSCELHAPSYLPVLPHFVATALTAKSGRHMCQPSTGLPRRLAASGTTRLAVQRLAHGCLPCRDCPPAGAENGKSLAAFPEASQLTVCVQRRTVKGQQSFMHVQGEPSPVT